MAEVKHREHDDGSHSIGVLIEGRYVPFATVPANIVRHYTQDVGSDDADAESEQDPGAGALAPGEPAGGPDTGDTTSTDAGGLAPGEPAGNDDTDTDEPR